VELETPPLATAAPAALFASHSLHHSYSHSLTLRVKHV
jgi:hypothetical protein